MPYFSREPRSSGWGWGDCITLPRKVRGLLLPSEQLPRPSCQLLRGMIHQLQKLPWELSGQSWIISRPLHISLLISLEYYTQIIPRIFVKNAFPDGIRHQDWSKSRPWWAMCAGIGYVPTTFANAVLSLSQHTWSARLLQAEAGGAGKTTRTPFWGLKRNGMG